MALHGTASLRDPHVSGSLPGWSSAGGEPTHVHAHGAPELLPEVLGTHVHARLAAASCGAAGHLRALGPRLLLNEGLHGTTRTLAFKIQAFATLHVLHASGIPCACQNRLLCIATSPALMHAVGLRDTPGP